MTPPFPLRLCRGAFALFVLFAVTPALPAASPGAALSGYVSNAATGNLLAGARVEVPAQIGRAHV